MTQCTATFETGVSGSDVLVADTGSATAWDTRSVAGGTIQYSNTHAASGSLSMKGVANASAQYMEWNTAMGTVTDSYGRMYLWIDAYPVGNWFFVAAYNSAGSNLSFRLLMQSAGVIIIQPGGGSTQFGSVPVTRGQWVRIEWRCINSATVGQVEFKLFNTATSSTPDETITTAADRNTQTNSTLIRFGSEQGGAETYWMDNLVAGATSYPGPIAIAPANTVAPAVTGTTALGDTLTSTTGTWTGTPTPTYTYQWQRDGSNIGGATAATRVIAAADQGTTLRCVVTATNTAGAVTANSNGVSVPAAVAAAGSGMNPGLLGYLYTHGRSGR